MTCLPQEREQDRGYQPPTRPNSHGVGRPVNEVRRDQLERLRTVGFSWAKIAQLLGVSVRTVYNRRQKLHIKDYSATSDADLDRLVTKILNVSDRVEGWCGRNVSCWISVASRCSSAVQIHEVKTYKSRSCRKRTTLT